MTSLILSSEGGGSLVVVGGALATSTDCCCEEGGEECGACGTSWPAEMQVDINAAGATGNAGATINGCGDADCEDLTGTYVLAKVECTTGGTWDVRYMTDMTPTVLVTFNWSDTCCWELSADDNPETLPCVTNTFGDVMYYGLRVRVALGDDSDYYLWVSVYFKDDLPESGGSGTTYQWLLNLGSTPPDCTTIDEALANAEYVYKGTFMGTPIENLDDACYYEDILLDVLAI